MQRPQFHQRLGLGLCVLTAALLAACGGGGESGSAAQDPLAALDQVVPPAAVPTICGVEAIAVSGAPAYTVSNNQTLTINAYQAPISLLTSPTGYPFDAPLPASLGLPLQDLREISYEGYSTQGTDNRMGIEMGTRMNAGTVACIAGVSRVMTSGSNTALVSLSSESVPTLPLDSLPGELVNGFELIHNLPATQATAVFTMSKAELSDASQAYVCHVSGADSIGVSCSVADAAQSTATSWILRSGISAPGVYVLVAPREPAQVF